LLSSLQDYCFFSFLSLQIHFYLKKEKVDEVVGFDPAGIEAKIVQWKAKAQPAFGGAGMKLGSGGPASSNPDDIRAARLKALQASGAASSSGNGGGSSAPKALSSAAAAAAMALDDEDEEAAAASALRAQIAASKARSGVMGGAGGGSASVSHAASSALFVPSAAHLGTLVEFGFSREKAWRALKATNNSSVEAALEWLDSHQDDKGVDDAIPGFSDGGAGGASSSSSSSSSSAMAIDLTDSAAAPSATATIAPAPAPSTLVGSLSSRTDITDEDKAAIAAAEALLQKEEQAAAGGVEPAVKRKLTPQEVQELLAKRKAEKAAKEKEEARLKEIKRRQEGQASQEMAEQIIEIQKKQQAEKIRLEKEAKEKETRRLKIEMIRDKIERHQKMHPSEPVPKEYLDQLKLLEFGPTAMAPAAGAAGAGGAGAAPVITDPKASFKQALTAIALYKAGIGLTCANTIRTLNKNAMDKPEEQKYRSINLANEKIKERISSVRGGLFALQASGWVRDHETNTMVLSEEAARDKARLQMTLDEIDAAIRAGSFNE
jgi:PUB domain/UBA/TS-N domain